MKPQKSTPNLYKINCTTYSKNKSHDECELNVSTGERMPFRGRFKQSKTCKEAPRFLTQSNRVILRNAQIVWKMCFRRFHDFMTVLFGCDGSLSLMPPQPNIHLKPKRKMRQEKLYNCGDAPLKTHQVCCAGLTALRWAISWSRTFWITKQSTFTMGLRYMMLCCGALQSRTRQPPQAQITICQA